MFAVLAFVACGATVPSNGAGTGGDDTATDAQLADLQEQDLPVVADAAVDVLADTAAPVDAAADLVKAEDAAPDVAAVEVQADVAPDIFDAGPQYSLALCQPCNADAECALVEKGSLCIDYGAEVGRFCGSNCSDDSACPKDYACKQSVGSKGNALQCRRTDGLCSCSSDAIKLGASTNCVSSNANGSCAGTRTCMPAGLSACDAPAATTEVCDGKDNNCDQKIDENFGDLGVACKVGIGPCASSGQKICAKDGSATVCSAIAGIGSAEVCDGLDNDCNGKTDEIFVDLTGDCTIGVGECLTKGKTLCSKDGTGTACSAVVVKGAAELCDGKDNDCNGKTDDGFVGLTEACAVGVGACVAKAKNVCSADGLAVVCSAVPAKAGVETCDGIDNNCDGKTDENFSNLSEPCVTGVGNCQNAGVKVCAVDGKSTVCDAVAGKATPETCDGLDNDCNGKTDETYSTLGKGCVLNVGGCSAQGAYICAKDGKATECGPIVGGNSAEICDGKDNNCDGNVDEGCDDDQDGYCDMKVQWVGAPKICPKGGGDCDDTDGSIHPGAAEPCDNVDENCDGKVDDGCDKDGDGYCDAKIFTIGKPAACPKGSGDCNDLDKTVNPSAVEICDDLDQNCNGVADDGCDDDKDGYCEDEWVLIGSPKVCPKGGKDCNDNSATSYPGAKEICDDVDNNCDYKVDEGCNKDGDFFCDASIATVGKPKICISGGGDCNDLDKAINPGVIDICDDIDNDCNGGIDTGCNADGDAYCTIGVATVGLPKVCPGGGGDCNDGNKNVNPGAIDVCNGVDDNCDGKMDNLVVPCDDGNPCTTDSCTGAAGCKSVILADKTACGDKMWCLVGKCIAKIYCGDGIKNQPDEQCDDGNLKDDDACSNTCKFGKCLGDWLVGSKCNGEDFGNGCDPKETGYHFKGLFNPDGDEYACWWHTKNQAWNTTKESNFWHLADHFKESPGDGGSTWCSTFDDDPCDQGTCSTGGSYFEEDNEGAWGWCAENDNSMGGWVCILNDANLTACQ